MRAAASTTAAEYFLPGWRVVRSIGPLTVSIGVAQYEPGEAIIETFARADAALYKAKQRGRNRVEVASPDMLERREQARPSTTSVAAISAKSAA